MPANAVEEPAMKAEVANEKIETEEDVVTKEIPFEVTESDYDNPRPSIITYFCNWGCKLGNKICKIQKRNEPEMLTICGQTLDSCNVKCSKRD